MLDSGHYELAEARKRAARLESLVIDSSLTSRKKTPLTELTHPINQTFRFAHVDYYRSIKKIFLNIE